MRTPCKNMQCKYYYELKKGKNCPAEAGCPGYTANRKKAEKKIIRCNKCEYCKKIYTNEGREYHYECTYKGRRKLLLLIEQRKCDCKL